MDGLFFIEQQRREIVPIQFDRLEQVIDCTAGVTDPKRRDLAAFSESAKHTPFVEGIAERGEVARSDCTRSC